MYGRFDDTSPPLSQPPPPPPRCREIRPSVVMWRPAGSHAAWVACCCFLVVAIRLRSGVRAIDSTGMCRLGSDADRLCFRIFTAAAHVLHHTRVKTEIFGKRAAMFLLKSYLFWPLRRDIEFMSTNGPVVFETRLPFGARMNSVPESDPMSTGDRRLFWLLFMSKICNRSKGTYRSESYSLDLYSAGLKREIFFYKPTHYVSIKLTLHCPTWRDKLFTWKALKKKTNQHCFDFGLCLVCECLLKIFAHKFLFRCLKIR